jgi:hypothetical protein
MSDRRHDARVSKEFTSFILVREGVLRTTDTVT